MRWNFIKNHSFFFENFIYIFFFFVNLNGNCFQCPFQMDFCCCFLFLIAKIFKSLFKMISCSHRMIFHEEGMEKRWRNIPILIQAGNVSFLTRILSAKNHGKGQEFLFVCNFLEIVQKVLECWSVIVPGRQKGLDHSHWTLAGKWKIGKWGKWENLGMCCCSHIH